MRYVDHDSEANELVDDLLAELGQPADLIGAVAELLTVFLISPSERKATFVRCALAYFLGNCFNKRIRGRVCPPRACLDLMITPLRFQNSARTLRPSECLTSRAVKPSVISGKSCLTLLRRRRYYAGRVISRLKKLPKTELRI